MPFYQTNPPGGGFEGGQRPEMGQTKPKYGGVLGCLGVNPPTHFGLAGTKETFGRSARSGDRRTTGRVYEGTSEGVAPHAATTERGPPIQETVKAACYLGGVGLGFWR